MPRKPLKNDTTAFAAWLRREMHARGMLQRELGEMIGLSERVISGRMSGHTLFKADEALILLHKFGVLSFINETPTAAERVARQTSQDKAKAELVLRFLEDLERLQSPPELPALPRAGTA